MQIVFLVTKTTGSLHKWVICSDWVITTRLLLMHVEISPSSECLIKLQDTFSFPLMNRSVYSNTVSSITNPSHPPPRLLQIGAAYPSIYIHADACVPTCTRRRHTLPPKGLISLSPTWWGGLFRLRRHNGPTKPCLQFLCFGPRAGNASCRLKLSPCFCLMRTARLADLHNCKYGMVEAEASPPSEI